MRLYGISAADVGLVASRPSRTQVDERGNLRLTGSDLQGRAIIVILAKDDPGFAITTFPDD